MNERSCRLLVLSCFVLPWSGDRLNAAGEPSDAAVKTAVTKSLTLLQSSAATYAKERDCFSCHHQALPAMTAALARERGFAVDGKAARAQAEFTLAYFGKRKAELRKGQGVPGGPYNAGYALVSLAADTRPADETTGALIQFLFQNQAEDGGWRIRTHRPPLEDSDFTATALSLRGLQLFAAASQKEDVAKRVDRARKWLVAATPKTHEDKVFRLFGLKWSGADKGDVQKAADLLLGEQRSDGGWAQLADRASDAYATGQALVALHQAGGVPVTHVVYARGVKYLLVNQRDDGSWLVESCSRPFQKYFESGFPHKNNQWISICATSWATMALALTRPEEDRTKIALPGVTGTEKP